MQPLSVVIITLNEAERIDRCIRSVQGLSDDILVVDSGSTDDTVALAEKAGARVVHQNWLGFGAQKKFATSQSRHDWVLALDADEWLSDALKQSIADVLQNPEADAYEMPRRNLFLGRWLRHGEGYPDYSLRLYNRNKANWREDRVHEAVHCSGKVGRLKGDLMHQSADTLQQYLHKHNRYTSLQAEQLFANGERFSLFKLLFSPWVRFVKFYFLRLGFLDGTAGLIHIAAGCWTVFAKHSKLLELQQRDTAKKG
ncbi:MAG: glycosyltransferase family 2 protein [Cryomorphaceae bacterium]|nr:MAG: glycosyltransferase family 2 protein [Cryomorphaceae bacterium]